MLWKDRSYKNNYTLKKKKKGRCLRCPGIGNEYIYTCNSRRRFLDYQT